MASLIPVRVRFAPSPTGFLHIGGIRTALFNYLYAKRNGGKFLLRVEDTDVERSNNEMVNVILDGLQYLGIEINEKIVYQSERKEKHVENAMKLKESGLAYYCACSSEEYAQLNKEAREKKIPASRIHSCREAGLDYKKGYALRFKVPENRLITFNDKIYGKIKIHTNQIEDFVLLRGNGYPAYQIAVVSDDVSMNITHVIRGEDHLSNTPKQVLIYEGLHEAVPEFAHLPLLLNNNGKKLSKRDGTVAITEFEKQGVYPDALINFISILGWSDGTNNELFTLSDLLRKFSFSGMNKKNSVCDFNKLSYINSLHIKNRAPERLMRDILDFYHKYHVGSFPNIQKSDYLRKVVALYQSRLKTLNDFFIYTANYFSEKVIYQDDAVKKYWEKSDETVNILRHEKNMLISIIDFSASNIENLVRDLAERLQMKAGSLIHPMRVALTGQKVSPGIFEVIELIGKEKSIRRLNDAIDFLA